MLTTVLRKHLIKFEQILKPLLKILKVLENFNKSFNTNLKNLLHTFELLSTIDFHCWLRRGLLPSLCKLFWFRRGRTFAVSPPGNANVKIDKT